MFDLRVITGICKGKKLYTPAGRKIRPTSDRVKEAVFSSIAEHVDGAVVWDAFSGTGNLGIEALSRGASFCYFSDIALPSVELTERNVNSCGLGDRSEIHRRDAQAMLDVFLQKGIRPDIIFLDPPYENRISGKLLGEIFRQDILALNGIIIFETSVKNEKDLNGFEVLRDRKYGDTRVIFLQKKGDI